MFTDVSWLNKKERRFVRSEQPHHDDMDAAVKTLTSVKVQVMMDSKRDFDEDDEEDDEQSSDYIALAPMEPELDDWNPLRDGLNPFFV